MNELAERAIDCATTEEVEALVREYRNKKFIAIIA